MKKRISALAVIAILLTLGACGKGDETPSTPAQEIAAEFRSAMKKDADSTPEEIAETLIGLPMIPFAGASMPVEPGWLNGFTTEITGFASGATFGPMIGSIPFVGYVFRLADGADPAAFVNMLRDNGDLAWNVCTRADEMVVETVGNTVLFVMSPADFEE